MPLLKRPLTFATPSIVNDTPEARAKVKRDLREILREAERYLGSQQLDQVVRDHRRARAGRKPNEALNKLVLAKWDASPTKDKTKFSKAFLQEHPKGHSEGAVKARLRRERKARIKSRKRKVGLQRLSRPSLVGEAGRTE